MNNNQIGEDFNDENIGPIQLNILERIEDGLLVNSSDLENKSSTNDINSNIKYMGNKEIIKTKGWVNVDNTYLEILFNIRSFLNSIVV